MKTLLNLQDGFMSLVKDVEPAYLKAFAEWLSEKLAEFKLYGTFELCKCKYHSQMLLILLKY